MSSHAKYLASSILQYLHVPIPKNQEEIDELLLHQFFLNALRYTPEAVAQKCERLILSLRKIFLENQKMFLLVFILL